MSMVLIYKSIAEAYLLYLKYFFTLLFSLKGAKVACPISYKIPLWTD